MTGIDSDAWYAEFKRQVAEKEDKLRAAIKQRVLTHGWLEELSPEAHVKVLQLESFGRPQIALAHINKKLYITLDAKTAGIYWIPVDKTMVIHRYSHAAPFGYTIEYKDDMSYVDVVRWINGLDSYHYAQSSILGLCLVLDNEVGYSHRFWGNHKNPWVFTVIKKGDKNG